MTSNEDLEIDKEDLIEYDTGEFNSNLDKISFGSKRRTVTLV